MPTTTDHKRWKTVLLFFGLTLIGVGSYQIPNIWINKSDLMQIRGTIKQARTYVSMVFHKSSKPPKTETASRRSELIFRLNEYEQEYYLVENIGDHYISEEQEAILKGLREADSVFVWIKKNEERAWRPQIFEIDSNERTLLGFDHLHIKNDPLTALLIGIGILLIIVSLAALLLEKLMVPGL